MQKRLPPVGRYSSLLLACFKKGRKVVVPSVDYTSAGSLCKGGASPDLHGKVIQQVVQAAAHAQQPGGQRGIVRPKRVAHPLDFRAGFREKSPEHGLAAFAVRQLKPVQAQGKENAAPFQQRAPLYANLVMAAFPLKTMHSCFPPCYAQ